MRERVKESMHSSKDNNLKDSEIITRGGSQIAGHKLYQQAGDGQQHE